MKISPQALFQYAVSNYKDNFIKVTAGNREPMLVELLHFPLATVHQFQGPLSHKQTGFGGSTNTQ